MSDPLFLFLACYAVGALLLALLAGATGFPSDTAATFIPFWPMVLAVAVVTLPCVGLYKLGERLRERLGAQR